AGREFSATSDVLLDSRSTTGELEAAMGLPRYLASDSPGSRIGSSAASKFGATGEELLWSGVSGRRLSKPRCAAPRGSNPRVCAPRFCFSERGSLLRSLPRLGFWPCGDT